MLPWFDKTNIGYLREKVKLHIWLNALQNVLDVGRQMWGSIQKHSESTVHDNTVKPNRSRQLWENIETSLHIIFKLKGVYKSLSMQKNQQSNKSFSEGQIIWYLRNSPVLLQIKNIQYLTIRTGMDLLIKKGLWTWTWMAYRNIKTNNGWRK